VRDHARARSSRGSSRRDLGVEILRYNQTSHRAKHPSAILAMSPSRGPPNRSPDPVYSAAARFFDLATVPEERKREEGAMRFGQSFVRVGFARESSARVRAEARPISRTTRLAVASASVETSTPRMRRRRRASPVNERRARLRPRVQTAKPPVNEEKMWCSRAPSRKPFLKRRGSVLRYLMRPVPVVLRPMALVDQLSVERKGEGSRASVSRPAGVQPYSRRMRYSISFLARRDRAWTYSYASARRGSRTRRTWPSGCGKTDDHTCFVIQR